MIGSAAGARQRRQRATRRDGGARLERPRLRRAVLPVLGERRHLGRRLDPDGDPLEGRSVSGHHVGDGGATFDVADLGDRVAFAVALPYTQPSDAGFLIGGEGLERTIVFALRDVNGAETSETWPVVIANRPPELVTQVGTVSTNHVYDATAGAYLASAKLSGWRDPDGDPMVQADFTGDAACPSYTLDVSGRAAVQCSLASAMSAVVGNFVGAHDIQQRVRDPWAASPVASVSRIENPQPSSRPRHSSRHAAGRVRPDPVLLRVGSGLLHGLQVGHLERAGNRGELRRGSRR